MFPQIFQIFAHTVNFVAVTGFEVVCRIARIAHKIGKSIKYQTFFARFPPPPFLNPESGMILPQILLNFHKILQIVFLLVELCKINLSIDHRPKKITNFDKL